MAHDNPRRGRPPGADPRQFRGAGNFTAAEWAAVKRRALLAGVSVAQYLHDRALADSPSELHVRGLVRGDVSGGVRRGE